jgi:glutaminyl-tRNA synthetase
LTFFTLSSLNTMNSDEIDVALTRCYGFAPNKLQDIRKNPEFTEKLIAVAKEAKVWEQGCSKAVGNLLFEVAAKFPEESLKHRSVLSESIARGDITNKVQLTEAFTFFTNLAGGDLDVSEFNKACGVGVQVTDEEIADTIRVLLQEKENEIKERGQWMFMDLFKILKDRLKWANQAQLRAKLEEIFGPMPKGKEPKKAAPAKPKEPEVKKPEEPAEKVALQDSVKFHAPHENKQKRLELLEQHLAATGGRVVTRFPPEPNGYLHLGHAKATNLNFGYAKKHGGWCYLRFDDTNPEKESMEYIESIQDSIAWLGHTPYKVTYASDYFPQLYNYAVELIKRDKAYVCHETKAQMNAARDARVKTGLPQPSKWRDRPIEESLKLFEDMRKGKFREGEATLRMKQDWTRDNPCMWDHVAYRIKYVPHPRTGDTWCIYPSYDFTHCLCDSIENITHSLCTLEFEVRRESYDWLVDALDIYHPPQIEYSRLRVNYSVLSKRKLITLVEGGYVTGWDDPRMLTINGLRRRGYPPEAINDLCERVGISRTHNVQDYSFLEECCRQYLETRVDRTMVVLRPLRVVLTNYPEDGIEYRTVPNRPDPKLLAAAAAAGAGGSSGSVSSNSSSGLESVATRQVPFSRIIYIDRNDFRLQDSPNYYRLAPGKEVRLKYAYNIKCEEVIRDDKGEVIELRATVDTQNKNKVKGNIHWVAQPAPGVEPTKVCVRLYDRLFKSEDPDKDNFLDELNPNSLVVVEGLANADITSRQVGERLQFEREGYFIVDQDTTPAKMVFNRIVTLNEDKHKDD